LALRKGETFRNLKNAVEEKRKGLRDNLGGREDGLVPSGA
jgi:hypothetical protein